MPRASSAMRVMAVPSSLRFALAGCRTDDGAERARRAILPRPGTGWGAHDIDDDGRRSGDDARRAAAATARRGAAQGPGGERRPAQALAGDRLGTPAPQQDPAA